MPEFKDFKSKNPLNFLAESYNKADYETAGYIRSDDGELSYIIGESLSAKESITGDWHDENESSENLGFNKLGSFFINSDRGARRQNQDIYYLNLGTEETPRLVMGIFDGLGGGKDGRLAASLAAVAVAISVRQNKNLIQAWEKMKQNIAQHNPEGDSTAVIVDIQEKILAGQKVKPVKIFSVGDSKVISIRDGKILKEGTTVPQNFAQEDLIAGKIDLNEYYNHQQLNRLTATVNSKKPDPELKEFISKPNDIIILFSDGLGDVVSDFEILKILNKNPNMEMFHWELFNLAKNRQTSEKAFDIEISEGIKVEKQLANQEGKRTLGDNITIGSIKIKDYLN